MRLQTRRPLTEKASNQATSNGVTAQATPQARPVLPTTKITKRTWISLNHIESKRCREIWTVVRWRFEAAEIAVEQKRQAEANGNEDQPTRTMLASRSLSRQGKMGKPSRESADNRDVNQ